MQHTLHTTESSQSVQRLFYNEMGDENDCITGVKTAKHKTKILGFMWQGFLSLLR